MDWELYQKWLTFYLQKGFAMAAADELAYIKTSNHEAIN